LHNDQQNVTFFGVWRPGSKAYDRQIGTHARFLYSTPGHICRPMFNCLEVIMPLKTSTSFHYAVPHTHIHTQPFYRSGFCPGLGEPVPES